MKLNVREGVNWVLPGDGLERKITLLFLAAIWLKFIVFNLVWCFGTTFTPFSRFELWAHSVLAALVLVIPYIYSRKAGIMFVIMAVLDIFLVANLVYFRTYNSIIPLESYGLWDNLSDYQNNVYLSLRWVDAIFFGITAAAVWGFYRIRGRKDSQPITRPGLAQRSRYLLLPICVFILAGVVQLSKGGFLHAYKTLKQSNKYSCATPMYTVFGGLYYDMAKEDYVYTDRIGEEIEGWLSVHNAERHSTGMVGQQNCIVMLLESLESWVIGLEVDGKEITPNLNRLVGDTTTLYAPHVLSQAKGGRSADGKLIINTGLLPIEDGSYSTQYAGNLFPSYVKAFREKYPEARAEILCVDKPSTWNQGIFWSSFGYDRMIGRAYFKEEDRVGPKKILGDVPFLRQCAEKIISGEYWDREGNNILQIVTYSGHYPFKLPPHLARISFETDMHPVMRDYITMANYTDHAVGQFLEMLRSEGLLDNTTLVITGDHEGLADNRESIVRTAAGRGKVSAENFTPLIVVNSGQSGVYEPVMGQIDIYPTLLDLFGLDDYWWKGLGRSILDPSKVSAAIDPQMQWVGNTTDTSAEMLGHMRKAWQISDMIIHHDYFAIGEEK